MFSAQNKIHKDKGVAPTDFEQEVAQVLSSFLNLVNVFFIGFLIDLF